VHERLTTVLLRAGRIPEAMEALRRAAGLSHPTPAILLQLAKLLNRSGEPKEALVYIEQALSEDPRHEEAARLKAKLSKALAR
jgi:predicted Zn-dependent protease